VKDTFNQHNMQEITYEEAETLASKKADKKLKRQKRIRSVIVFGILAVYLLGFIAQLFNM
jgi:hypothetical protein